MTRRLITVLRSLVAILATLVMTVVVPFLLVTQVGWPLPSDVLSVDGVVAALETGISPDTIAGVLAIVVWFAWSQFALALVAELVGAVVRRPVRSPVLPGARHAAAQLVGTMLLVATSTSIARPALALDLAPGIAVEQQLVDGSQAAVSPPPPARAPAATLTVQPRDSWWRIAEQHLGDGLRWRELRALNVGRTVHDGTVITATTDALHTGWVLVVPDGTGDSPLEGEGRTWTVSPGDNLWDVAEQTLVDEDGRLPSEDETHTYWRELIETNREELKHEQDPDHIIPGQVLSLPRVGVEAAIDDGAADRERVPPDLSRLPTADQNPPPRADAPEAPDGTVTGAEDRARDSDPRTQDRDPADGGSVATTSSAGDADEPAGASNSDDGTGADVLPASLAAAGLIAAGVLHVLRRRRRVAYAKRRAGMRFPTPHPGLEATDSRLAAAETNSDVLDDLWSLLRTLPETASPSLVRMKGDRVTLTFDEQSPAAPAPWTAVEDGTPGGEWRADLGSTGDARSVGLPLLVTLGRDHDGTQVFANLAASGPLVVTGPDVEVRRRMRTMTLEVATSPVAHTPEVLVLGDAMFEDLDTVTPVDDPTPMIAEAVSAVASGILDEDRTPLLIVCHDDRDLHVPRCSDLALLRAGDSPTAGACLSLDGELGSYRSGGTELELALPAIDTDVVEHTIAACHPVLAVESSTDNEDRDSTGESTPRQTDDASPGSTYCEVRLLGPVDVLIGGEPIDTLSPQLLELLLYLSTHRDNATPERTQDALWPGVPPRSASERLRKALTRLRAALGDGPNGEPLVPRRVRGGDGRIGLSDYVSTDLDQALGWVRQAREQEAPIEMLESAMTALECVRGPALETIPLSWASEVEQRAIIDLQDIAHAAARAAVSVGRPHDARRALRLGLRLLPEAILLRDALTELHGAPAERAVVD